MFLLSFLPRFFNKKEVPFLVLWQCLQLASFQEIKLSTFILIHYRFTEVIFSTKELNLQIYD